MGIACPHSRVQVLVMGAIHSELDLNGLARLSQDLSLRSHELNLHKIFAGFEDHEDSGSKVHSSAFDLC